MNIFRCALQVHPSHPKGGHPPHSNLVRGKLTSPTPTLQETGPTVLRPIREDEKKLGKSGCFVGYRKMWARIRKKGFICQKSKTKLGFAPLGPPYGPWYPGPS